MCNASLLILMEHLVSGSNDQGIKIWALPDGVMQSCLIDLAANTDDVEGVTYEGSDAFGNITTFTLPCGSAIPAGAICTCNCVGLPGTLCTCVGHVSCSCVGDTCSCVGHSSGGFGTYWYPN